MLTHVQQRCLRTRPSSHSLKIDRQGLVVLRCLPPRLFDIHAACSKRAAADEPHLHGVNDHAEGERRTVAQVGALRLRARSHPPLALHSPAAGSAKLMRALWATVAKTKELK